MDFVKKYLRETAKISKEINYKAVNDIVDNLVKIRNNRGRIFVVGVGGSAANASHFVNDLRKICKIDAYCPTDNVAEITARTNDNGFDTVFEDYLKTSFISDIDCLFVLSVGGGNEKRGLSTNIIKAIQTAKRHKARVFSIVGRDDGYAFAESNICISLMNHAGDLFDNARITPHAESFQSILCHCIVSHPDLGLEKTVW
jgi:D-sedoheptulose 7-phosphate isomerase